LYPVSLMACLALLTVLAPSPVRAAGPAPSAVRYARADWIEPAVTLRNAAGLPAEPFALPVRAGKAGQP